MRDGIKEFINEIPFEQFLKYAEKRDIVIWGKGAIGEKTLDVLSKKRYQISCAIDRDASLSRWHNMEVRRPDYLKGKKGKIYCIIAIKQFQQDIENYLKEIGYEEGKDYLFLFHKPTTIKEQPHKDIYGNEWSGKVGSGVSITAYNCKLHIDSDIEPICDFFASHSIVTIKEKTLLGKGAVYCYQDAHIEIDAESRLAENFLIECSNHSSISIGNNVNFASNATIVCHNDSIISIGDKCDFGLDVLLKSIENGVLKIGKVCSVRSYFKCATQFGGAIEIGDDFLVSFNVAILNNDAHPIFDVVTSKQINCGVRTIKIGAHVWAGIKSTILSGAYIGAGTIIGANSVVTKRFPNNCIIGGVPAKILRKNVAWKESLRSETDKRYWNLTEDTWTM